MTKYMDIKDIAKNVRKQLNTEFPKCKWSVRIQRYSGGQSLGVYLMGAPFKVFAIPKTINGYDNGGHAQLNKYQLLDKYPDNKRICNGRYLTKKAWTVLKRACEIMDADNWDRSDIMVDYFDVNYYSDISIGKWNKDFTFLG